MSRPSLCDSFLALPGRPGLRVPADALERDVGEPPEPSPAVQRVLVGVYRDDGGPAQVAERLVDLDEGLQEWRYRHVKMVERTIGTKPGTGGSPGAAYLARPCRARVPRPLGHPDRAVIDPRRPAAPRPTRSRRTTRRFRVGRAAAAHRALAPGLARRRPRGPGRGVRRRRRGGRRQVGRGPSPRPTRCAPATAACSTTRRARSRSAASTHELVVRLLSALDLRTPAPAGHDRRRVPHPAPPARPASPRRAWRWCACRPTPVGHAGRAAGRRRRRPHGGRAGLGGAVRHRPHRPAPRRPGGRVPGHGASSCWSTPTTRSTSCRCPSTSWAWATPACSAAATSTASWARATASCACRRTPPSCARCHRAGSPSSTPWPTPPPPGGSAYGRRRATASPAPPTTRPATTGPRRVFEFFAEQGLTPALLREVSQHQVGVLAAAFDALDAPDAVVTRDRCHPAGGLRRIPGPALAAGRRARAALRAPASPATAAARPPRSVPRPTCPTTSSGAPWPPWARPSGCARLLKPL